MVTCKDAAGQLLGRRPAAVPSSRPFHRLLLGVGTARCCCCAARLGAHGCHSKHTQFGHADICRQQLRGSLVRRGYSRRQPGRWHLLPASGHGRIKLLVCHSRGLVCGVFLKCLSRPLPRRAAVGVSTEQRLQVDRGPAEKRRLTS